MSIHLASPDDHSKHCRGMDLAVSVVEIMFAVCGVDVKICCSTAGESWSWLAEDCLGYLLWNHGHGLLESVFADYVESWPWLVESCL